MPLKGISCYFWRLMPFMLGVLLILLSSIPLHFFPYYPYRVNWCLVPIFYFAIYNPKCLSSWAVFLVGVLAEMLVQSPFGVTTFCFVFMFFCANFFRKYLLELTFWPLWGIFILLLLIVELLAYGLVVLITPYPISSQPVWASLIVLVLVYPFLMRFSAWLDKRAREAA